MSFICIKNYFVVILFCIRILFVSSINPSLPTLEAVEFELEGSGQLPDALLPSAAEQLKHSHQILHGDYLDDDPDNFHAPAHYRLDHYLQTNYNSRVLPRRIVNQTVNVSVRIEIYQIIEIDVPQQFILLNAWIVERWNDDMLYWNPARFEGLREISLPKDSIWLPDTTLYNSLVMDEAESKRLINVKITTQPERKTTLVELLYPTLIKTSCPLDLRLFPYDLQACKLTFGSWTHDNKAINYFPHNASGKSAISTKHCIENEEWNIVGTTVIRKEIKFDCCANNYTLLEFYIHVRRRPLYYLVNLIAPTGMITLIAIVGFFSSSTMNDVREEKMTLGITTLLSMSILLFMIADKLPSMGSSIPLIGWFFAFSMTLIGTATLAATIVIYTQKRGIIGTRPSAKTMRWARRFGRLMWIKMPLIMIQAYALKAKEEKMRKHAGRKHSVWSKWQKLSKDIRRASIIDPHRLHISHSGAHVGEHESSPSAGPHLNHSNSAPAANRLRTRQINFEKTESPTEMTNFGNGEIKFADDEADADRVSDDITSNFGGGGAENPAYHQSRTTSLASGIGFAVNSMSHKRSIGSERQDFMDLQSMSGAEIDLTNMTALQQRNLAQLEWDWIAAVVERVFLIAFITLFATYCIGTLLLGFLYATYVNSIP
uniref:Neurotransmitter-gated ion-channel ligand-binding domain-containing protein n=1 Tax=Panagrellus redivivus TaxID=6233 RepID=A0A7E4UUX8_PANRE